MRGIKRMGWILVFSCLLTFAFVLPSGKHEKSPEILIIDDFGLSEHGKVTTQVTKKWSLGSCETKSFHTSRDHLSYIKALHKALKHVTKSPNRKFIINISLGSEKYSKIEEDIIELFDKMDVIVVAAVGNDGEDKLLYPAAYEEVVAVAASKHEHKADYSNYGSHVDLAVETRERKSVKRHERWTPLYTEVTEITTIKAGTSVSAPKLAGILALLWDSNPDMSKEKLLITMRKSCNPIQDRYYAAGKLGVGLLDDFSIMMNNSQKVRLMFFLLIIEALLLIVIFFSSLREVFPAICFFGMLCCLLPLLFAFSDVAWILKWGYLSLPGCFITCVVIYLCFTSPLGGKRIYISYDPAYIVATKAGSAEIYLLRERIRRMMAESKAGRIEISDLKERFREMREDSETRKAEISKLQEKLQKMKEEERKRIAISHLISILKKMGAQVTTSDAIPEKSRPHCRVHFTEREYKISRRSLFLSHRYITKTMKIPSGMFSPASVADVIKKTLDG